MADDELAPDELAPDPNEPPGRVLVGILGESANGENVLLYIDLELRKRYEIPKSAVLRRQKLPAAQSPLGVDASMIWVRPDTILTLQLNQPRRVEDEFLAGDFTAPGSFTPREAAPLPQWPLPTCSWDSSIGVCPTRSCWSWHYCGGGSRWWCP